MAIIKFYANNLISDFDIDMAGSGLGFYGSGGFGSSVAVGEYQENTYVTDATGANRGPHGNNVKWTHANSGEVSGSTNLGVNYIPNYQASLNVRFTHSSAVQIQNAELRIYDRTSIDDGASGVTTKAYETCHISVSQAVAGSGDAAWTTPSGSGTVLSLTQSPGESGLNATGSSVVADDRHDWYVALSARPDSIGSKTLYGLYVSLEYL